jgi:hypothetical protein
MNKTLAIVLFVVGVLLVVAVLLAAPLHLASAGFGLKKIFGLAVGVIVLAVGAVGLFAKGKPKAS